MITVKATREGLAGGKTSTGYRIDSIVRFVALPAAAAQRQWIRLCNPANGKTCTALVLDVGPWNENDNAYVFQDLTNPKYTLNGLDGIPAIPPATAGVRPQAESGVDTFKRVTNHAGIDLGEAVWAALEMGGNTDVSWEFLG